MADDKTFTEEQHLAILADRVVKETAALTEQVATVTAEKSEVESKLDAAETAKVAAEQAAEKAVADLEAYKAEQEKAKLEGDRKETRLAAVKEVAGHMPDEFFTDEKRVARIVAMDDEAFAGYTEDLKAAAPAVAGGASGAPRETAMSGDGSTGAGGETSTGSHASTVLLGRFGRGQTAQTGA